jgi:hypothetical protein
MVFRAYVVTQDPTLAYHRVMVFFYLPVLAIYGIPALNSVARVKEIAYGQD